MSSDRKTLTLFYLENLPAAAHLRATFDAAGIRTRPATPSTPTVTGNPGGTFTLEFETAGITGLPNTAVVGHVFAAEKQDDGSNRPLENVTVTVDGAEERSYDHGRERPLPTSTGSGGSLLVMSMAVPPWAVSGQRRVLSVRGQSVGSGSSPAARTTSPAGPGRFPAAHSG